MHSHSTRVQPYQRERETVHKNLGEIIRALLGESQNSWDKYTSSITLPFNSVKSRATFYSPHFLMFRRPPRIELDILGNDRENVESEDEYVGQDLDRICKEFAFV